MPRTKLVPPGMDDTLQHNVHNQWGWVHTTAGRKMGSWTSTIQETRKLGYHLKVSVHGGGIDLCPPWRYRHTYLETSLVPQAFPYFTVWDSLVIEESLGTRLGLGGPGSQQHMSATWTFESFDQQMSDVRLETSINLGVHCLKEFRRRNFSCLFW